MAVSGALVLAALAGGTTRAQQIGSEYEFIKKQVKSGKTEDADLKQIDEWIRQGKHGSTIRIPRGAPETMCLYQLKVILLYNRHLRTSGPRGEWLDELKDAVEHSRADRTTCNADIGESDLQAMWTAFDREWGAYQKDVVAQQLQRLREGCQQIKTTYAGRMPLADLSCEVGDDPKAFQASLVDRARQIGSQLQRLWQQYGEGAVAAQTPQPGPDTSPADAFAALASWIERTAQIRKEVWDRKLGDRKRELDALPAEEREGFGPAPKPGDLAEWAFWERLGNLDTEIGNIAGTGRDLQKRKAELLAQYGSAFPPATQRSCKGLDDLCASSWAARACQEPAPRQLRDDCSQARVDAGSASAAALGRAVGAAAKLGDSQRWRAAADAIRGYVTSEARRVRKNCENQPELVAKMDSAVGALSGASIEDAQQFGQAVATVRQCEQGAAFRYRRLAEAFSVVEGVDGTCVASLARTRQQIEKAANDIARDARAANESVLTAGRDELAQAIACVEKSWSEERDRNRAAIEKERQIAEQAKAWMSSANDPRYATLRSRVESAIPAGNDTDSSCETEGGSASDAVRTEDDPVQVVEDWARCAPAAAEAGASGCRLLLVSALACLGEELGQGRWDEAASKLRSVNEECGQSLNGKDRGVLDYFTAYVASKTGSNPGIPAESIPRLGYDPRFDRTLEAQSAQRGVQ